MANTRLKEATEARELRATFDSLQARLQAADAREVSLRRALRRRHKQLGYARKVRVRVRVSLQP